MIGILALALGLRLVVGLAQDHRSVYGDTGGDSLWYMANGYALVTGIEQGQVSAYETNRWPDGYPVAVNNLPTPPLYLLFIGVPQTIFSREGAVIAIRVFQALMSAATCYLAFRLGRTLTGEARAGLVAAGVLAISPVFVLESAQITTETLYIFLVTAALTAYVEHYNGSLRWLVVSGALLGLATLTRAVLLLFPLGLGLHLLMACGLRDGLKRGLVLLVIYICMVGSWTAYNLIRWNQWVIGAQGFAAFLYLGATPGGWQGPEATDAALAGGGDLPTDPDDQQDIYLEHAQRIISSDLPGYLEHRVRQLAEAYAQPHGTLLFSGASVRDLLATWLRDDHSLSGLLDLTRTSGFWPKLALYVFHYLGLLLGVIGLWQTRRRWRLALPLAGFLLYTTLIHLVLEAIPRYIFPTMVFWWVFAGAAAAAIWQTRRRSSTVIPQPLEAEPSAH